MNGFLVRRFWKWLPGLLMAVGSASAQAQTVEYLHTDALGTLVAVTNAAGVVIERSEYEPYGKLLNRPLTDGPGFTGHVQDAATGLTYMQQRYYDPAIGRFLSADPVTGDPNSGSNFNRYKYASNNPYMFVDPDGQYDLQFFSLKFDRRLYDLGKRFDVPGWYTIGGHASHLPYGRMQDQTGMQKPNDMYNAEDLSANSLWARASNNGLRPGQTIFVDGCTVGSDQNFGQTLANNNQSTVYVTTGYSRTHELENGDVRVDATKNENGTGGAVGWDVYAPGGRSSGAKIMSVTAHKDGSASVKFRYTELGSRIPKTETVHAKK